MRTKFEINPTTRNCEHGVKKCEPSRISRNKHIYLKFYFTWSTTDVVLNLSADPNLIIDGR